MKRLKTILAEAVRSAVLTSSGKEVPHEHDIKYNPLSAMVGHLKTHLPHYSKADHEEAGDYHKSKSLEHEKNYMQTRDPMEFINSSRSATLAGAHHHIASDMEQ